MKQVVMTAALLACTAMFAVAQTAIGYNKNIQDTGFLIKSTQFTGSSTADEVLGAQLPLGSKVVVFDDAGYSSTTL